ncbi:zinc finger protein 704-like [Oppia nitens]|uniref:zinc finger protein 704-like n=1 Tax=Oppia nitens TaxID=1686743 RepID=UPI0023D98D59|nr:zinc finger protein 704-like [Oppia nitens]XP_054159208.1 zinc finger protein 704-like [Oppia nitens]
MSCGKRLAKRSIVGTRVSAPFDGHYFSAVITRVKSGSPLDSVDTLYSVLFDRAINGRRVLLDFRANQLIGSGFQPITAVTLKAGQKVYITYNGREVSAAVDSHDPSSAANEVSLIVDQPMVNNDICVRLPLAECRLNESRKSARLLECDTDYSKLANDGHHTRQRTASIDTPNAYNNRKRRPSNVDDDDDYNVMDDCMAAMVLMSLSCSPKSPSIDTRLKKTLPANTKQKLFNNNNNNNITGNYNNNESLTDSVDEGIEMDDMIAFAFDDIKSQTTSMIIYKCTWPGCRLQYETCDQIEQHVRTMHLGKIGDNSDREEEFYYTEVELRTQSSKRSSISNSSSFSTTESSSAESSPHPSPGPQSPAAAVGSGGDHNCCKSDEIQSPIPSPHVFTAGCCSSSAPPIVWHHLNDHEYLKPYCRHQQSSAHQSSLQTPANTAFQWFAGNINSNTCLNNNNNTIDNNNNNNGMTTLPINIPSSSSSSPPTATTTISTPFNAQLYSMSAPVSLNTDDNHHQLSKSFNKYIKMNSTTKVGAIISKGLSSNNNNNVIKPLAAKRVRGESRKCRKVYGLDNRDNWCTQCKWKKACTRFTD